MVITMLLNKFKKIFIVISMILFLIFNRQVAYAKPLYIDKLNISWDLRPDGIAIPYQTYIAGVGYKTATIKFSKFTWKVNGDQVTFKCKIVVKDKANLTNKEIHKSANSGYDTKRYTHCDVVDRRTGKSLLNADNCDIKFDLSKANYVYDSHGCKVQVGNGVMYLNFTIDIPDDGIICFVAGGSTKKLLDDETYNDKYDLGKAKFGQTSYVDKKKLIAHAMKIKVR